MTPSSFERLRPFAYVDAEQASEYRAIMRVFIAAKEGFSLHLRPADVLTRLRRLAPDLSLEEELIEPRLSQLCAWGNLEAHPDTAAVATVEDFYRRRLLFQLTAAGEAAERALALYHQVLTQPGELKTAALDDIRSLLEDLVRLAKEDGPDSGKVFLALQSLAHRFEELTARAQTFMGGLQRRIDLQGVELEALMSYKEQLVDYLERFIGELVMATSEISRLLGEIEKAGPDRLLRLAAERDVADAMTATEDPFDEALETWRQRWHGLTAWFTHQSGTSQAEILRSRARSAIPALLAAVETLHDQRLTRSDRSTDFRTLARWFAEADSERDAHRLWRAAFGLTSCRHLRIDAASLERDDQDPVAPTTSWLDAPPLRLTARLRKTGRYARPIQPSRLIDRSQAKALLAELAAEEAQQIATAQRRLSTDGRIRLSALGALDTTAFDLFLDLLGEALARRTKGTETVTATSSDGVLEIVLEPMNEGTATLETSHGQFSGPDHWITIEPVDSLLAAFAPETSIAPEAFP
ncbi:MAG: TIGR02677 family protein [Acidobacteriota bacterium]